jgi:hypothetical protein
LCKGTGGENEIRNDGGKREIMLMQDLKDAFNQLIVITEIEYGNSRGVLLIHFDNSKVMTS